MRKKSLRMPTPFTIYLMVVEICAKTDAKKDREKILKVYFLVLIEMSLVPTVITLLFYRPTS